MPPSLWAVHRGLAVWGVEPDFEKQGNESVLSQKSYVEEASGSILVMFAA